MPLNLPEPSRDRLPHAQLDLVVCQIKHERNPLSSDPKRALAVQAAVREAYPAIEDLGAQEFNIVMEGGVNPSPVSASTETTRGWRFRSDDQQWTVVLMPDFFALETTQYTDWTDFKNRLTALVRAVEAELTPAIETRIGLRYIDRLTEPKVASAAAWSQYIQPSLLGPVLHDGLGPGINQVQQLVQIDGGDGCQVLLRHGCFPSGDADNTWTYLLDHDCSHARSRPFETDAVLDGIERLHTLALQVFQASITEEMTKVLRGEQS